MNIIYKFHFLNGISEINQLFDDILIIWPAPVGACQFAGLKALVQHPREPLTRDKLMNLARGREWGAMERSIDVQVSRLRRLIEENPARARYIQTVWGVGYVFVPDGAE